MEEKYQPTKNLVRRLFERCQYAKCNDPAGTEDWPCRKCRISNTYERLTGIRIEDMT